MVEDVAQQGGVVADAGGQAVDFAADGVAVGAIELAEEEVVHLVVQVGAVEQCRVQVASLRTPNSEFRTKEVVPVVGTVVERLVLHAVGHVALAAGRHHAEEEGGGVAVEGPFFRLFHLFNQGRLLGLGLWALRRVFLEFAQLFLFLLRVGHNGQVAEHAAVGLAAFHVYGGGGEFVIGREGESLAAVDGEVANGLLAVLVHQGVDAARPVALAAEAVGAVLGTLRRVHRLQLVAVVAGDVQQAVRHALQPEGHVVTLRLQGEEGGQQGGYSEYFLHL